MINFIICDDNDRDRQKIIKIVDKFMMKNQLYYGKHVFTDYDDNFLKIINSKISFKIYILDIEAPSRSGIDIARIIRNKDVNSILIFLTGHNELADNVVKNDFLFLSFINKFDNCEARLLKALTESIRILGIKKNLRFKDNGVIYTICFDDILYISKDTIERKCIIKTDYSEFKVNKTLNELISMLDDNFIYSHRSCIINSKRVIAFDKYNKKILFDVGISTDLVSKNFNMI